MNLKAVNKTQSEISSDGALVLLEKIERKHKLIKRFSKYIPDKRDKHMIKYSIEEQLKQRVFMLMLGYEDANDVIQLKNDPLFKDILQNNLASQPTISRFENSSDKHSIFALINFWVDNYVSSLNGRKSIVINIDATDDKTYGKQQLSLFNGYYGHFIYNELLFHDGQTGQIILSVLRPGKSHYNKWYVALLKRVIEKIRAKYPNMEITIRTDSGFSGSEFYKLVDEYNLYYATGIASNNILKKQTKALEKIVKETYLSQKEKHQSFIGFNYKAESWHKDQQCYAKVESTGKGMNVRYFTSNTKAKTGEEIYFDFYVKRGDASENRIKEVKNMCFSDRLSDHRYWANFFRLFISSLAYEMFLLLKQAIKQTNDEKAKKWQISSIRIYLLKVGQA